ncbi:mannose-1-phosphate guanylyltransferase / mannose-6-phosphate isomerase [Monaibacterium marinum]|uniref:mannose-1-phosphate guanylyltransferase n=1 Tax=Pontivivens marinum TaxID=1690039 RepID=A0A2C9CVD4_9RHOB|nr:mannose-1-phosphate guanylyltransferase/mannose-6-phosphate isomerase [Monaibacterium marinum]SOH95441.1 mannose-1-phosphate guanylyltransferase / mannose-6-phosphate isomerase [Monaibacterium marinum]
MTASTATIHPLILAGGSGTRLWPLSRKSYPKQFAPLIGETSLFQQSLARLSGSGYGAPVVVTGSDFRFIVTEQMMAAGFEPEAVLIEPEGRNTAPAILAAALHLSATDPDALMLVAPSDHVIPDADEFRAAVSLGAHAAQNGQIVTFGIRPTTPETGYGWLELEQGAATGAQPLVRFVEKPDPATATTMLNAGHYLWNAGLFLFSARTILDAFATHAPDLLPPVQAAISKAKPDLGFLRLDPQAWAGAPDISIDYAVMEKANNLTVVPFEERWSDLGSWKAVAAEMDVDENGNALSGPATAVDCKNTLLRAEDSSQELVGLNLDNIAVVAMRDAVLVANMDSAQDVKLAVNALKEKGAPQATTFPRCHRPWGWYETLSLGPRFQVKRIMVHPGAALSLQSHVHRSEHWTVVEGAAMVTVGEERKLMGENQSVYIPLGAVHRLENPGKVDLHLIEVQSGPYLGEDDIIRYEDVYART